MSLSRRALLSGLPLSLAACAPTVQRAGIPPAGFTGPALGERSFVSADGVRLPLDVWRPKDAEPWGAIVALHGMNDYANAFATSAPWWAEQGIATYAYDQRGFGRGPGRGLWGGTALLTEDLRTLTALVRARHPGATVGVLGHSMGGAVAVSAFASDRPPAADRLVLAAPAVWGWSRQSLPNKLALWVSAHVAPGWRLTPPDWLARRIQASDNIEILRAMGRDRNMIFDTRVDAVYGLVNLMQRADRGIGAVKAPTLFLYGANDQIIPKEAALHAARGLKPTDRSAYYAKGWHLLTRDLQGPVVWKDIEAFLRDAAAPLPSGAPPLPNRAT
jgi:alpha-beta hydrolase superfamily lysophospholipase